MKSSQLSTGFILATAGMLIVMSGCRSRQIYAPRPLAIPQGPLQLVSVEAERGGFGTEVNASQIASDDNFTEAFTPDQAAEFAVLNHPSLRTIRDDRGLACAQIIQAGILANPKLDASFDTPAFGATAGTVTADTQAVSWDISQLRPRSAKLRAAAANVTAVDMDILWQEWQFAQTARQAVYDLAVLENQLKVLTASQNGLEENLKIVEKAVNDGNLTIVDLSAAESAAIASRANTLAAKQQLQQQRVTLNRSLGRPPESPVSVNPSIEFPDKLELPSEQDLLAISEGRPDVEAIRRSYESQEETLRAAIASQIPTTSLVLTRAASRWLYW